MFLRDVWFSYRGILNEELSKKNYFVFFRKIFGSLYKSLLKFIRNKFSINSTNLDKIENKYLSSLELDKLFVYFKSKSKVNKSDIIYTFTYQKVFKFDISMNNIIFM